MGRPRILEMLRYVEVESPHQRTGGGREEDQ